MQIIGLYQSLKAKEEADYRFLPFFVPYCKRRLLFLQAPDMPYFQMTSDYLFNPFESEACACL